MPRLWTASLKQNAVLWSAAYSSGGDPVTISTGQQKVNAAVALKVRWEEKETDSLDADGNTIRLDGVVVVDRDVTIGSILWLGDKKTMPTAPTDLHEVVTFNKTIAIKGKRYRRVCGVQRYSDSLPPIAS
jgi:hypothetical protein